MQYFNPHSHEGSDCMQHIMQQRLVNFNPHSHEGSDQIGFETMLKSKEFQSTLPRRERLGQLQVKLVANGISIHTPTKGATIDGILSQTVPCISIHTPTKGATKSAVQLTDPFKISIHTPTKGATQEIGNIYT